MITLPLNKDIETKKILKQSIQAHKALAHLNGVAKIIPNQNILINSLILQEAKDSSEIENIITTHDELYLANISNEKLSKEVKEVKNYKDLLEVLFLHPYTKIEFLVDILGLTRQTSSKYLKEIEKIGILQEVKIGRNRYFIHSKLFELLKKTLNC